MLILVCIGDLGVLRRVPYVRCFNLQIPVPAIVDNVSVEILDIGVCT